MTGRCQWEYAVHIFDMAKGPALLQRGLSQDGLEGWELVSVLGMKGQEGGPQLLCLFKRPRLVVGLG